MVVPVSSLAPREAETRWRSIAAGPTVALAGLLAAVFATRSAGVPLRDPGGVSSARLAVAAGLVALLIVVDVAVRAQRRSGWRRPSLAAVAHVRRERWPAFRLAATAVTVLSFYATYFAYRNIKSVVPLLRPETLVDRQLLDLDRDVLGGADPAALLHDLLGTGAAAHALSAIYMFFFVFIPVTLAVALVWSDGRAGLFLTTALSANWLLAAASYLLLPSIGPFHADPATFAALPSTAVSSLQAVLLEQRDAFLGNPAAPGAAQSIGAFASLHTSICCTVAIAAHLLGFPGVLKIALWVMAGLTVTATIYFGWHYLLDDAGGLVIALLALCAARVLTGFDLGTVRRLRRTSASMPEPA
jgi:hypothetical protein